MASASWFWTAAAAAARRSSSSFGSKSSCLLGVSLVGSSALPSTASSSTTKCESVAGFIEQQQQQQHKLPKKSVLLQPRMTSMGRFAFLSETAHNPSVPTFVVALVGDPFTTKDFERAWQRRDMSQRHARFQQCIGASGNKSERRRIQFVPTRQPLSQHVTETIFPTLYRVDIKDRLRSVLTQPYPVYERLWNVQISTGGRVGQSGIIPKRLAKALVTMRENESSSSSLSSSRSSSSIGRRHAPLTESLIVFSAHHALADGVSLSAAFTDLCDEGPELQAMIQQEWQQHCSKSSRHHRRRKWWQALQRRVQSVFGFMWACLRALGYQFQIWLESPSRNPLQDLLSSLDDDHDDSRRTLSWSQVASVDEMKRVAQSLGGDKVTVNDVIVSCVSAAIAKLLQHHRQHLSIMEDVQRGHLEQETNHHSTTTRETTTSNSTMKKLVKSINVVIPVHLGGGVLLPGQSLGNKIGAMVARIPCEMQQKNHQPQLQNDPVHDDDTTEMAVHRLKQIHSILGHVKHSPAALISYATARTLASPPVSWLLPSSWISAMFRRAHVGATCVITNVRGPTKELHIEGRSVVTAQPFLPLPPGIPIGVALFSYAGVMNVSVHAQEWAVPNADQFLLWVVEEYQRLLEISRQPKQ